MAYVTENIEWLESRKDWRCLKCIRAIHTGFEDRIRKRESGIIISAVKT